MKLHGPPSELPPPPVLPGPPPGLLPGPPGPLPGPPGNGGTIGGMIGGMIGGTIGGIGGGGGGQAPGGGPPPGPATPPVTSPGPATPPSISPGPAMPPSTFSRLTACPTTSPDTRPPDPVTKLSSKPNTVLFSALSNIAPQELEAVLPPVTPPSPGKPGVYICPVGSVAVSGLPATYEYGSIPCALPCTLSGERN